MSLVLILVYYQLDIHVCCYPVRKCVLIMIIFYIKSNTLSTEHAPLKLCGNKSHKSGDRNHMEHGHKHTQTNRALGVRSISVQPSSEMYSDYQCNYHNILSRANCRAALAIASTRVTHPHFVGFCKSSARARVTFTFLFIRRHTRPNDMSSNVARARLAGLSVL